MNILIIGCGRVGSGLANSLSKQGHDIAVVDNHPENFSRLGDDFSGFYVAGVPIDSDVLRKAGIEGCDFLAAVTPDDNVNLMVSQIAREIFNVPKVLTRLYDPARKNIFAEFGIHTICPTSLTVDIIQHIVNQSDQESVQMSFGNTSLSFSTLAVPKSYHGVAVSEVRYDYDETILAVIHEDGSLTFKDSAEDYKLRASDKLLCVRLV